MQILLPDMLRVLRLCVAYCDMSHRSEVASENLSHLSFGEFGNDDSDAVVVLVAHQVHVCINYDTGNICQDLYQRLPQTEVEL